MKKSKLRFGLDVDGTIFDNTNYLLTWMRNFYGIDFGNFMKEMYSHQKVIDLHLNEGDRTYRFYKHMPIFYDALVFIQACIKHDIELVLITNRCQQVMPPTLNNLIGHINHSYSNFPIDVVSTYDPIYNKDSKEGVKREYFKRDNKYDLYVDDNYSYVMDAIDSGVKNVFWIEREGYKTSYDRPNTPGDWYILHNRHVRTFFDIVCKCKFLQDIFKKESWYGECEKNM